MQINDDDDDDINGDAASFSTTGYPIPTRNRKMLRGSYGPSVCSSLQKNAAGVRDGCIFACCAVEDPCEPSPCENSQPCVRSAGDFHCSCDPRYTGAYCEHGQLAASSHHLRSQGDGGTPPPPEIGFTRKFLAPPLS